MVMKPGGGGGGDPNIKKVGNLKLTPKGDQSWLAHFLTPKIH